MAIEAKQLAQIDKEKRKAGEILRRRGVVYALIIEAKRSHVQECRPEGVSNCEYRVAVRLFTALNTAFHSPGPPEVDFTPTNEQLEDSKFDGGFKKFLKLLQLESPWRTSFPNMFDEFRKVNYLREFHAPTRVPGVGFVLRTNKRREIPQVLLIIDPVQTNLPVRGAS